MTYFEWKKLLLYYLPYRLCTIEKKHKQLFSTTKKQKNKTKQKTLLTN